MLRLPVGGSEDRSRSQSMGVENSFTVDIDESLLLDCSLPHGGGLVAPAGAVGGRLHIDRAKVRLRGVIPMRYLSA